MQHDKVAVNCPRDGVVMVPTGTVDLYISTVNTTRSYYQTVCPKCTSTVMRLAAAWDVAFLTENGASVHTWDIPAEAFEPRRGEPIGWDDVLDFRLAIDAADDLVGCMA